MTELASHLEAVRDTGPEGLVLFSGLNSRSDEDLIERFAEAYGTPNLVTEDSFESKAEKSGRWFADGNYSQIAYDFGQANYILAFGASIVESERPLARNLRMWGKMRREKPNRTKVGKVKGAERSGPSPAEIDDANAFKWKTGAGS